MNLYMKLLILILKRLFWKKTQLITDLCSTSFRVGLIDLDLNFHMNNGRYLSVMDLGRFDMLIKTNSFLKVFKNGYYPVVLSESIVFKKSLNLFEKYKLHTNIYGWDDKFFYIKQNFMKGEELVASANVRACFKQRNRKGIVPVKELYAFIGESHEEVKLTDLAKKQIELDEVLIPRN